MRKVLLLGLGTGTALSLVLRTCRPGTLSPAPPVPGDTRDATRNVLLGFILPVWLLAGIADWWCHRKADIEHTSGFPESALHLLMLGEAAVPVLAGLFLEISPPVLLLMAGAFIVHEATALWDVTLASKRRVVSPIEQHVHSFLEMIPLMALAFVAVLHWPQVSSIFGMRGRTADWSIRWKRQKLPATYIGSLLAAIVILEWMPYLEEAWRTSHPRKARPLRF